MKIAVVYNRDSRSVINLFGLPSREKYGQESIKRIVDSLKRGGHQSIAFEGDKDLIDRLEDFMPRVLKGERPGMVFNLSYGIQGQARYTHVPSILEMVGIPYVGSGPLAHSLALDKVVAKMIFRQHGLPTPDFVLLNDPDFAEPDLPYPLIVKPKNEAVSFGIEIVHDIDDLRRAAGVIFDRYRQPVLAERYVEGREINVGILGNQPPEALSPVELRFGEGGPPIYTCEDKKGESGREIEVICPAPLSAQEIETAQDLAKRAFAALGCFDCARVDMRRDAEGRFHILELNSLPSLAGRGSYMVATAEAGLDLTALVNRLVEVASARYFGSPTPPQVEVGETEPPSVIFSFLTQRRDRMERRVQEWSKISRRTSDPVGIQAAVKELDRLFRDLGMRPVPSSTDDRAVWTWETEKGFDGGVLLVVHIDVPLELDATGSAYRRDPEWLTGEGVGSTHAPLVMVEYALRAIRSARKIRRRRLGVLCYSDEGRDCRYSGETIRAAAARAKYVLVLRPGGAGDTVIYQRRGQRKYRLTIEGRAGRLGAPGTKQEVLRWALGRLDQISELSSRKERLAISAVDIRTEAFPLHIPHRLTATLLMSHGSGSSADEAEARMRSMLRSERYKSKLQVVGDRPPMADRPGSRALFQTFAGVARRWEIPLQEQSSVWPSAAGLVSDGASVLCGLGPVAQDLYTPHEAVLRISLLQRTLLLAEYLHEEGGG